MNFIRILIIFLVFLIGCPIFYVIVQTTLNAILKKLFNKKNIKETNAGIIDDDESFNDIYVSVLDNKYNVLDTQLIPFTFKVIDNKFCLTNKRPVLFKSNLFNQKIDNHNVKYYIIKNSLGESFFAGELTDPLSLANNIQPCFGAYQLQLIIHKDDVQDRIINNHIIVEILK